MSLPHPIPEEFPGLIARRFQLLAEPMRVHYRIGDEELLGLLGDPSEQAA